MRRSPAQRIALLSAVTLIIGACGSEITPPSGWQGWAGETSVGQDVEPDTSPDSGLDVEGPADECAVDADCEDKFATFPCQRPACLSGECKVAADPDGSTCDDNDPCTQDEACETGTCVPQVYVSCSDGDPCTDEACDSNQGGCVYTPTSGGFCNDDNSCTIGDSCKSGVCAGLPTNACYSGNCCAVGDTPGCDNGDLRMCVCTADPACCSLDATWTQHCVDLLETAGCGFCPSADCGDGECSDSEDCAGCPADCGYCADCGDGACGADENCFSCSPDCGPCAGPLCGDLVCGTPSEDCTSCAADCGECTGAVCGDGTCELNEHCQSCPADCGVCAAGCGDGVCAISEGCQECPLDCGVCVGNCCTENSQPGCDQELIEACVCEADDYCCNNAWDGVCVAQVETEGCAQCSGVICGDGLCTPEEEDCDSCEMDCGKCPFCGDGVCNESSESCESCEQDCGDCTSGCCSPQNGPGCGSASIEACVCSADSYCCTNLWDSLCASEVVSMGCGNCP